MIARPEQVRSNMFETATMDRIKSLPSKGTMDYCYRCAGKISFPELGERFIIVTSTLEGFNGYWDVETI